MSQPRYSVSLQLTQEQEELRQELRRELRLSDREIYEAGLSMLKDKINAG